MPGMFWNISVKVWWGPARRRTSPSRACGSPGRWPRAPPCPGGARARPRRCRRRSGRERRGENLAHACARRARPTRAPPRPSAAGRRRTSPATRAPAPCRPRTTSRASPPASAAEAPPAGGWWRRWPASTPCSRSWPRRPSPGPRMSPSVTAGGSPTWVKRSLVKSVPVVSSKSSPASQQCGTWGVSRRRTRRPPRSRTSSLASARGGRGA